ncbi:MAG: hypothetical protein D3910_01880 [Candidatus Electrothrix sp. ATG2]|nr:hypothetical protein [Candidatus Electrothrix sp. ATG2]
MADQGFLKSNLKGFRKRPFFKRYSFNLMFIIFIFSLSGCATPTTFRVLDAETKQPIEGAVALAEWTSSSGLPGLSHTDTVKVAEDVSDSEGKLTIPGTIGFNALQTPHIKVYKPGYVGWDSRRIYLGYRGDNITRTRTKKRSNFVMKNQDIFLEPWDDEKHSYISHGNFISTTADFLEAGMRSDDSKYRKAIEYEVPFYLKEDEMLRTRGY